MRRRQERRATLVGPIQRSLYLRKLPLLGELPAGELAAIAHHLRERSLRRGEALLEAGRRPRALSVIVEGAVQMIDVATKKAETIGPAQPVGILPLLAHSSAVGETRAVEDTLVLELDASVFFDLLEDRFALFQHVLKTLAAQILVRRRQLPADSILGEAAAIVAPRERPLELVERMLVIRKSLAFRRTNLEAVADMARHVIEVRYERGDELWRPGDAADFRDLVVSGAVTGRLDDDRVIHWRPGSAPGDAEALAGVPRWYGAVAEGSLITLRSENETLLDVLEDHFDMARELIAGMARELMKPAG